MIEEQSEKRTFDMGTQAVVDDQDLVMPEILGFDHEGIPPSESFGDGEYSPLQERKIAEADEISVADL